MNKVLSVEQMKHLQELGVDTSNASLYWIVNTKDEKGHKKNLMSPFLSFQKTTMGVGAMKFEAVPAYTLQDILNLLPNNDKLWVVIDLGMKEIDLMRTNGETEFEYFVYCIHEVTRDNLLESAYEMLCYCRKYKFY